MYASNQNGRTILCHCEETDVTTTLKKESWAVSEEFSAGWYHTLKTETVIVYRPLCRLLYPVSLLAITEIYTPSVRVRLRFRACTYA